MIIFSVITIMHHNHYKIYHQRSKGSLKRILDMGVRMSANMNVATSYLISQQPYCCISQFLHSHFNLTLLRIKTQVLIDLVSWFTWASKG